MSIYVDINKNLSISVCPPKGESTKTIGQDEDKWGGDANNIGK
jgi:hypothetical protein